MRLATVAKFNYSLNAVGMVHACFLSIYFIGLIKLEIKLKPSIKHCKPSMFHFFSAHKLWISFVSFEI